jgi:hypothetical protein
VGLLSLPLSALRPCYGWADARVSQTAPKQTPFRVTVDARRLRTGAPKSPHTTRSLSQPRIRQAGEKPTIAGKVPKPSCLGIPVVGSTSHIYFFQPALHGANRGYGAMNYQALANDGLTLLYETIRAALKADDSLTSGGDEPRFRIRDTGEWRKLAAALETEMIKRGMMFEVIEWDAGQIKLPLGD